MKSIQLKAPAKINLGLSILGKLANGYHDVKTIYTQIDLFDDVVLTEIEHDVIEIVCNQDSIPVDNHNIAYKAAELIKQQYQITTGININIHKRIPAGSGLGGGSSDAAAVLKGLDQLWNLKISEQKMFELAQKLGADVAYQIVGGVKMETQGGEKTGIFMSLPNLRFCYICLCYPGIKRESKRAFGEIDYSLVGKNDLVGLIYAIQSYNLKLIASSLYNDFELWTLSKFHQIKEIRDVMLKYGALGSLMSGKGSSVFGIFGDKTAAITTANLLEQRYSNTYCVQSVINQ